MLTNSWIVKTSFRNIRTMLLCPKEFSKDPYLVLMFKQYKNHDSLFWWSCQYLGVTNNNKEWTPKKVYNIMINAGYKLSKGLLDIEFKKKIRMNLQLSKECVNCSRKFIANRLGMATCYSCNTYKFINSLRP